MAASKSSKSAPAPVVDDLVAGMLAQRSAPAPKEGSSKFYAGTISRGDDMNARDWAEAEAARDVVAIVLREILGNVQDAIAAAVVDLDRVTLRRAAGSDRVTANLPVAYVSEGRTAYVNVGCALPAPVAEVLIRHGFYESVAAKAPTAGK